ncbi:hypothetical protein TPA0910_81450 [Streptomyces hygroscopicus subsp. sporocinereus]|uniref:Uncharacterized protein n=1 Tax=Streptomyces hygroscopicus TaxID=1912 RepID=A0ABQ3UDN2_STRHY|nr:hypothetical protein TPA0910_81450 [Streptomyces hygroscopicus]
MRGSAGGGRGHRAAPTAGTPARMPAPTAGTGPRTGKTIRVRPAYAEGDAGGGPEETVPGAASAGVCPARRPGTRARRGGRKPERAAP